MCSGVGRGDRGNGGHDPYDRRMALNKRTGKVTRPDPRSREAGDPIQGNGNRGSRRQDPWWRWFTDPALALPLILRTHPAYDRRP